MCRHAVGVGWELGNCLGTETVTTPAPSLKYLLCGFLQETYAKLQSRVSGRDKVEDKATGGEKVQGNSQE